MNNLRKLFVAITLTVILAGTVLADCPAPGEVTTPPCTSTQQQVDDSAGQAATDATISDTVDNVVLDLVIDGLENLLTVY